MKKCATIKRLEMQLQYQFEIEEGYPNFLTRRAYETVYVEKPNNLRNNRYAHLWIKTTLKARLDQEQCVCACLAN